MLWLLHYPSSERWRGPGLVTALIFIQWHSDNWTLASDAGDLITAISESSRSSQRKTGHSHQLMNLNWWPEPVLGPLLLCSSSNIGKALKYSRKNIISHRYSPLADDRSATLCVCLSPSSGSLFQWKLGSYYPASCLCLSLNGIYDVKKLAFFAPSVSSAHMSNVPPTSVCRQDKKFWLILLPGIDMAVGCLMDKQKYRLTFYWRNQEGFIRWAKSRDNIVNRDIWNKMPLSSSLQPPISILNSLKFSF